MDSDPGRRTADFAAKAASPTAMTSYQGLSTKVIDSLSWSKHNDKLSSYMCWDAMLACAWYANGIASQAVETALQADKSDFGIVNSQSAGRVFDNQSVDITSLQQLVGEIAPGSFIGFFRGDTLIHAMIYIERARGAGTKNGCIFSDCKPNWCELDLTRIFRTDGKNHPDVTMKARSVVGQKI